MKASNEARKRQGVVIRDSQALPIPTERHAFSFGFVLGITFGICTGIITLALMFLWEAGSEQS